MRAGCASWKQLSELSTEGSVVAFVRCACFVSLLQRSGRRLGQPSGHAARKSAYARFVTSPRSMHVRGPLAWAAAAVPSGHAQLPETHAPLAHSPFARHAASTAASGGAPASADVSTCVPPQATSTAATARAL